MLLHDYRISGGKTTYGLTRQHQAAPSILALPAMLVTTFHTSNISVNIKYEEAHCLYGMALNSTNSAFIPGSAPRRSFNWGICSENSAHFVMILTLVPIDCSREQKDVWGIHDDILVIFLYFDEFFNWCISR